MPSWGSTEEQATNSKIEEQEEYNFFFFKGVHFSQKTYNRHRTGSPEHIRNLIKSYKVVSHSLGVRIRAMMFFNLGSDFKKVQSVPGLDCLVKN